MASPAKAPADKFGALKVGADTEMGTFRKLAQRVEETMTNEILHPEPKQLDPDSVWVGINNRLGAAPNVRHVHYGILGSLLKYSFDRSRPHIGICVKYTSEAGIKKLYEHNKRFTLGNRLMPPLKDLSGPVYGSIACTHLNLALRCIKHGLQSPAGDLSSLMCESLPTLREAVIGGHRWWILPETCAKDKQTDISLWRNQDQNENQATSEVEVLQTIKHAAMGMLETGASTVALHNLVSKAQRKNPAKISIGTWQTLSKFFVGFLENDQMGLVEDLTEYHSACVDPRDLTASTEFFKLIANEDAFKACPHLRCHLVLAQYTKEKVRASPSGPNVSQFLEHAQIASFAKKPDQVLLVEQAIKDLKAKYLPLLEPVLGPREARFELATYVTLILRCLFGKAWPEGLEPKAPSLGKFSAEKIKELGIPWAKVVDHRHAGIGFAVTAGLQPAAPADKKDEEDSQSVSLEGLRALKKSSSDGPEPGVHKFKRDDKVTVTRRMSWEVATKENPKFRKDVIEGAEGTIMGFADAAMRQVLLKVDLVIKWKKQSITHACYPRNLQLTSEYLLDQLGGEPAPSPGAKPALDEG